MKSGVGLMEKKRSANLGFWMRIEGSRDFDVVGF